ncbi:MAG TPA: hypothetical protein VL574_00240, partial [Stellaceae bacterium]|nr:hypothetical protein [Stellaceae bacterium]
MTPHPMDGRFEPMTRGSAPSMPGDIAQAISPLLAVEGLSKHYATRSGEPIVALSPTEMTLADGEFVCVVGPSGCGK